MDKIMRIKEVLHSCILILVLMLSRG